MSRTIETMSPLELFDTCETALAITGLPQFNSADQAGQLEWLKYLPATTDGDADCWALVPVDGDGEEYVAVDTGMALQVLLSHFRDWLLQRGWQLQVHCYATTRRWTLVDCLSAADGGGDRLDVDYPYGDDQLAVLVDSVIAVNTVH